MKPDEKFLGDGHYTGLSHSMHRTLEDITQEDCNIRAIIEHAIHRLKAWGCLHTPWRHLFENHFVAFKLSVHLTNIQFDFAPVHVNVNPNLLNKF